MVASHTEFSFEQILVALRELFNEMNLIHNAVKQNDLSLVQKLIKLGVDVNKKDKSGRSTLQYFEDFSVYQALILAGAKFNTIDKSTTIPDSTATTLKFSRGLKS